MAESLGRDRRRLGPERARGGDRARPGGALGEGARGGGHDRRRRAHGGADAAGLPARRVLGRSIRSRWPRRSCAGCRSREHGLEFAHPRDPARAPARRRHARSRSTARSTRRPRGSGADADAYRELMAPLARTWKTLAGDLLGPLRLPRHPFAAARFGAAADIRSATGFARARFAGARARALFAGNAAHAMRPLESRATASFGLMLLLARPRRRLAAAARRLAGDHRRDGLAAALARR